MPGPPTGAARHRPPPPAARDMMHPAYEVGVRLIAEGIETRAELETLRGLGVTHGQGYLMGRPGDGRGPGPWLSSIALPA